MMQRREKLLGFVHCWRIVINIFTIWAAIVWRHESALELLSRWLEHSRSVLGKHRGNFQNPPTQAMLFLLLFAAAATSSSCSSSSLYKTCGVSIKPPPLTPPWYTWESPRRGNILNRERRPNSLHSFFSASFLSFLPDASILFAAPAPGLFYPDQFFQLSSSVRLTKACLICWKEAGVLRVTNVAFYF